VVEFIVMFIIGAAAGVMLMILYIAYRFKMILNELDKYIEEATNSVLLGITVEKHNDTYRFYRAKDNQFMLQTVTLDNIREVFSKQFPNKTCYVEGGDPEAVEQLKRELQGSTAKSE
jgi:hypothetical protein